MVVTYLDFNLFFVEIILLKFWDFILIVTKLEIKLSFSSRGIAHVTSMDP